LYWLFNGKGVFPSAVKIEDTKQDTIAPALNYGKLLSETDKNKTIERIVIFYSDGSFKNYEN